MTRIDLAVYVHPSEVETYITIQTNNGWETVTATIDTGAVISLFDSGLLSTIKHGPTRLIRVEQAGIAHQHFQAVETEIVAFVQDANGNQSELFSFRAWFSDTQVNLLGFDGILDASRLVIDMPKREAYLDVPSPIAE